MFVLSVPVSQHKSFFPFPTSIPATPLSLPASIGIHSFSIKQPQAIKSVTMPFDLSKCARKNILKLEPYRCAREYVQPPSNSLHSADNETNESVTTKMMERTFCSTPTRMPTVLVWR